jgi:hypothetical protein
MKSKTRAGGWTGSCMVDASKVAVAAQKHIQTTGVCDRNGVGDE